MTEPTNPIMLRQAEKPRSGKVTVEMLEDLRVRLNRSAFVRDSGLPYFITNRLQGDGTYKHELDRKVANPLKHNPAHKAAIC